MIQVRSTTRRSPAEWEQTFRQWSRPLGEVEQERCENAERMIRDAIGASSALRPYTVEVFAKGSYANNTNIRGDSDVDIAVHCPAWGWSDFTFAEGLTDEAMGNTSTGYTFRQFKSDVEDALVAKFGRPAVTRGDKAFDVSENTYRIAADVVPSFDHRRYVRRRDGTVHLEHGTELLTDGGVRIINWPRQQYENGVTKNGRTGGRYKDHVRILKYLREEMEAAGVRAAEGLASYLLECLVYNVPDDQLRLNSYYLSCRQVIARIYNATLTDEAASEWLEVNERKYLLRGGTSWTREIVHAFAGEAWTFIGFAE